MDAKRRRTLLRAAGWILAAYLIIRVGSDLAEGLRALRRQPLQPDTRWTAIGLSGAVFLIAHGILVQTWRSVLGCWGERLPFWNAARIWSVSNLARYVPGKIWQIGAMGAMARELNVSPLAASGSALLGTLVNIMTGFVVALVSGGTLLGEASPRLEGPVMIGIALGTTALVFAPIIIPRIAPFASRLLKRPVEATFPARAVVYSMLGNVTAWLVYGAAFQLFVAGVLGNADGGYPRYLAAYTTSYLVGYIFLFAPAGVGFREAAMLDVLQRAEMASYPQAALVTLTSRLWLTLLEVMPALLFWAHHRARRSPTTDPSDVPT